MRGAASRLTAPPSLARRSTTFMPVASCSAGVTTVPAPGVAPSAEKVLGMTANTLTSLATFSRAIVAPPKA